MVEDQRYKADGLKDSESLLSASFMHEIQEMEDPNDKRPTVTDPTLFLAFQARKLSIKIPIAEGTAKNIAWITWYPNQSFSNQSFNKAEVSVLHSDQKADLELNLRTPTWDHLSSSFLAHAWKEPSRHPNAKKRMDSNSHELPEEEPIESYMFPDKRKEDPEAHRGRVCKEEPGLIRHQIPAFSPRCWSNLNHDSHAHPSGLCWPAAQRHTKGQSGLAHQDGLVQDGLVGTEVVPVIPRLKAS
ncbi:hypothetical protein MJG53_012012 [Ovis ammon polii x Ovis aries]|uniref:Uncharacterized protein n=1 Tax=Ovis ammon polii x Ovis aries TaxID=2918886 RepID=A0ACB9UQ02_9CETA|nr:hypothetical protein MJG53_012012 [Ovis ammon polii x Ovis aries]